MAVRVVNVRQARDAMNLAERSYLVETAKGLALTARHFFGNVFARKYTKTIQYPEEKQKYPERFRGRHRLMKRDDGDARCVACMCCSTACPALCIHIVAGEHADPAIEKYPVKFDIDLMKCIFCGMCVEACPCDAIRMDTGVHAEPGTTREEIFADKLDLLKDGGFSIAAQGGVHHRR